MKEIYDPQDTGNSPEEDEQNDLPDTSDDRNLDEEEWEEDHPNRIDPDEE